VQVSPESDEVPPNTRLCVTLIVRGLRVGRHGLHGLSLEVESGPNLFEVPLTFANPFGVEVMPAPYAVWVRSGRGGRSRQQADEGCGLRLLQRVLAEARIERERERGEGPPYNPEVERDRSVDAAAGLLQERSARVDPVAAGLARELSAGAARVQPAQAQAHRQGHPRLQPGQCRRRQGG